MSSPSRPASQALTTSVTEGSCMSPFTTLNCSRVFGVTLTLNFSGRMGSVSRRHFLYTSPYASGGASSARCPSAHVTVHPSPLTEPLPLRPPPKAFAMSRPTDGFSATISLMGLSIRKGRADTSAGKGHKPRRASSLSIRSLSKPTIQAFPILMTGTPLCPVFLTRSRAALGSLSTLISLNETPFSRKYFFARRHQEQVDVLKITGLVMRGPPYRSSLGIAQLAAHHHHAARTRVLIPLHGHAYAPVGGSELRGGQVQLGVAALVDGKGAGA